MASPNGRTESEDLAERLRSLYQLYHCESELPNYDDLVAKLDSTKPKIIDGIKTELNRDCVYPISYERALQSTKQTFTQKLISGFVIASVEGVEYAVSEFHKNKREPNDFLLKLYALYGGIKNLPSSVRRAFLSREEEEAEAKELMEEHNKNVAQCFKGFKNNMTYILKMEK